MEINDLDIKFLRKKAKLSQTEFAVSIGVSLASVQKWEHGERHPNRNTVKKIIEKYKMYLSSSEEEEKPSINEKKGKVPYFDIDVTSHITHSFSDVHETPSFYVDYQPFNDCEAYVNNYGDSMFPKYKNGERLAVKQIHNLDVINWGETYLVITNDHANNLKTVKDVHPHKDFDKIILKASNPSYAGDTVINKEDVLSIYAIKGKISQNFI